MKIILKDYYSDYGMSMVCLSRWINSYVNNGTAGLEKIVTSLILWPVLPTLSSCRFETIVS